MIPETYPEKEVLVTVFNDRISMLIPRKYGPRFLQHPFAYQNAELAGLLKYMGMEATAIEGSIDIKLSAAQGQAMAAERDNFLARIVMPVALHYGFYYREVSREEYWDNHPLKA